MILVMEAGYHGIVAFSACSTLPVSASIRSRASALARAAARLVAAQAIIASRRVRNGAEGAEKCKSAVRVVRPETRCFPAREGQLSKRLREQKQKDALAIFRP